MIALMIGITNVKQAKAEQLKNPIVITFNKGSIDPLQTAPKKTEIIIGISNDQMDEFNQNPTPDKIKQFMQTIASEYGVDWKLVYAIGYHESGNYGSSLAQRNNNYFGRKANSSGYASWATPEDGIRNQFVYLKTRYFDRGMDTPAKINPVYAEDSSWQVAVTSVMNSL
jgi:flagellum-specific peptidoglycan hydrolase FlgJ